MYIYDSFSRSKRKFKNEGKVNMYYCGPTVYDDIHLGNALSAVRADLIRRFLIAKGYKVKFVANWTDIDDKMIDRAALKKIKVSELAAEVIPQIEDVYNKLNVLPVDQRMFATRSMNEIFEMVKILLSRDVAYKISDGIYFDVSKFEAYGQLSNQDLSALEAGTRVDVNDEKRNPQDFVLWKHAKPNEPIFKDSESIVPDGRPGWHIECSAMNYIAFGGETVDIHLGGIDLKFPHHECEIAQSEACFGNKFVDFWCHNGYLLTDGEKMSKSLNNFKYAKDLFLEFNPLDLRFFLLATHYRAPLEFTLKAMQAASNARYKLQNFYAYIFKTTASKDSSETLLSSIKEAKQLFFDAMEDDFQISKALSHIFDLIHLVFHKDDYTKSELGALQEFLTEINLVLGVFKTDLQIPVYVLDLAKKRYEARLNKDYATSDKLRMEIHNLGYQVRDNQDCYEVY